ncbi:MAG: ParB/RepB/Spo0J family partition protein [Oscillospiraceae bacterium]|nr:ParB/RepB/Spo0J family partition protein [Oscillospiraceae bacterium]MBQ7129796.1 ParB/RepB/Spo0J family partition protein [Oscillospiraceae bacterium]
MVQAMQLPVDKLRPFEGHPFQVKDDAEMDQLVWSILTQGLLTPITVRPLENNEYEVISGHRRLHACQKAGIETVPALIYTLDRDAAAIALVDSNLHREKILPSEKAYAYKLKMDAMSRQGERTDLTSTQVGRKLETAEIIGEQSGESKNQVRRYVRLTELIPEILSMVDSGRIALTPAVELSYLTRLEQRDLLETMESEDCTPSLSQAIQLKKLSQVGELNMDKIFEILREPKANQQDKISFRTTELKKYFPKSYDAARIQAHIIKLLEADYRKRQRAQER